MHLVQTLAKNGYDVLYFLFYGPTTGLVGSVLACVFEYTYFWYEVNMVYTFWGAMTLRDPWSCVGSGDGYHYYSSLRVGRKPNISCP